MARPTVLTVKIIKNKIQVSLLDKYTSSYEVITHFSLNCLSFVTVWTHFPVMPNENEPRCSSS